MDQRPTKKFRGPKKKTHRKTNKTVDLTSTNKYRHWEIRALTVGMMCRYMPNAAADLNTLITQHGKEQGLNLFCNSLIAIGATHYPYSEPVLHNLNGSGSK